MTTFFRARGIEPLLCPRQGAAIIFGLNPCVCQEFNIAIFLLSTPIKEIFQTRRALAILTILNHQLCDDDCNILNLRREKSARVNRVFKILLRFDGPVKLVAPLPHHLINRRTLISIQIRSGDRVLEDVNRSLRLAAI